MQLEFNNAFHSRASNCVKAMVRRFGNGLYDFCKAHREHRWLGELYKNCKAHTKIG